MFFMILGTYRNQTFIDFSPAQRIQLMIFLCHTVTHGTDLRRSPQVQGHCSLSILEVVQCHLSFHNADDKGSTHLNFLGLADAISMGGTGSIISRTG